MLLPTARRLVTTLTELPRFLKRGEQEGKKGRKWNGEKPKILKENIYIYIYTSRHNSSQDK